MEKQNIMKKYKKTVKTFSVKKNKTDIPSAKITSSKDAYDYIKNYLYGSDIDVYESFWLLLLNRANNITGFVKISQGGITGTIVDTKLIAKYVVEELSSAVIIAHNHPSGNNIPSEIDKQITNKIIKVLKLFDTELIDHLIITSENGYFSFNDEGLV